MTEHRDRMLVLGISLVLLAACSGSDLVEQPGPEVSPVSTATTTTALSGPVAVSHDDHLAAPPDPPLGPGPSFNESAGCDVPQGVRGPYADSGGRLPDEQGLAGPWGDFYGRSVSEIREALVAMELPNVEGAPPVLVYVHERVAPALQAVVDALERERERGRSYRIDPGSTFSFAPLSVPPGRYLSFHAVGAAIDVNATANPYRADNELITDMPGWFVQAWIDAGWCWGGDWQTIKDPMHFSWMGPRHTPGYRIPARVEPTVPAGTFTRSVTVETGLGPGPVGATHLVADLDRDGAVDAIRVERDPVTGRLGVIAAAAIHRYDTCMRLGPTPDASVPSPILLMADATGDARPDLWLMTPSDDGLRATIFTFDSSYTRHLPSFEIRFPVGIADSLHLADHDLDGLVDLHVVSTGTRPSVTVLRGPDFATPIQSTRLEGVVDGWRFTLGLRDLDRVPDLFALSPGEAARLAIFDGASGFAADPEIVDTAVGRHDGRLATDDVDGDGHADLVVVDSDGVLTAYLGGDRDGMSDQQLMAWFLERDDRPWEYRAGCPEFGRAPR